MNKSIIVILFLAIPMTLYAYSHNAYASQDKLTVCHKTASATNPWVIQTINANEFQSHIANGDFLYVGNFDIHTQDAVNWCANQGVTPTPTCTPTLTISPTSTSSPSATPTDTTTPAPTNDPTPGNNPNPNPNPNPTPTPKYPDAPMTGRAAD